MILRYDLLWDRMWFVPTCPVFIGTAACRAVIISNSTVISILVFDHDFCYLN